MVRAIEDGARERAAYLADPHEREADRAEFLKMIDKRRDDAVKAAKLELDNEFEKVATVYQRSKKTSYDEAAVAAAWGRVKSLLDTFRGVDDIVEREGFDRNEAEALRRNLATYTAAQLPEARPVDIERRVRPDLYRVLRAELRLMDRGEAEATQAEIERIASADVVRAVDKMGVTAAMAGRVAPQELLEVGFATSAAGFEPDGQTWSDIVREVDPEAAARAARETLPADARESLAANARDAGPRRP
jgi:hypothetical protein